jgi:hypothetical protein
MEAALGGTNMMRDDDHEQRCDDGQKWRAQIQLPAEMVESFREWWDSAGWWSFRAWHEKATGADSEWENFMRSLYGEPPAKKLPAVSSGLTDPKIV